MRFRRLALVGAIVLVTSGYTCWELGVGSPAVTASAPVLVPSATVLVHSDNWSRAVIYVGQENGVVYRLGDVETNRTVPFRIRVYPGMRTLFAVKVIAHSTLYTDPMQIDSGDVVRLAIANYLPFTTVYRAH